MAILTAVGGCRSVVPVPPSAEDGGEPASTEPLRQRIVVLVHGDASYLYHDSDGTAHQADEETLREAFAAARAMPQAEVFVFHQRPRDSFLGLIPRDDGTVYHFRHGRLVHRATYDQTRTEPFAAEARLLRTHRTAAPDSSLFTAALYYGHAVPKRARPGYHRSRPAVPFGVDRLARGLGRLTIGRSRFDAVVLSTCDGGTPRTLAALAPHARFVLASPGDLHLSFVDADLLAEVARVTNGAEWTQNLAERAFGRLTGRTTTAVTLATYDVDRAASSARRMAARVRPDTTVAPTGGAHVDCRDMLGPFVDTTGVRSWYRPPQFGPRADRESHSGWGCARRNGTRESE